MNWFTKLYRSWAERLGFKLEPTEEQKEEDKRIVREAEQNQVAQLKARNRTRKRAKLRWLEGVFHSEFEEVGFGIQNRRQATTGALRYNQIQVQKKLRRKARHSYTRYVKNKNEGFLE